MFGVIQAYPLCFRVLWWCLWSLCAEIADGKLIEMKGRVNIGLKSENVVIWVEKCDALRVWKAKSGFSGNGRLKWVNPSLKCHLGLMESLGWANEKNEWPKWKQESFLG